MDDNELVMRSVYLKPKEDSELRQLAHDLNVTKSDLIRSAIGVKLREWLDSNSRDVVLKDLEAGRREPALGRTKEPASGRVRNTASTSPNQAVPARPARKPAPRPSTPHKAMSTE